eukprot:3149776-Ditylum_brightwellii.AAC.1
MVATRSTSSGLAHREQGGCSVHVERSSIPKETLQCWGCDSTLPIPAEDNVFKCGYCLAIQEVNGGDRPK